MRPFKILFGLILIMITISCHRKSVYHTHTKNSDSTAVSKQVKKDSVVILKKETVHDTFTNTIVLSQPCDSTGKLKNGFRQVFSNGAFTAEVVIENNEIKVKFKGEKLVDREMKSTEKLERSDTSTVSINKSVATDNSKEIEKGTGFWDKLKMYLSYIYTIVLSIIAWELFLKRLLKLIKII